jgi:hypothetical protein
MTDTTPRWASVSARITHGTATQVEIPSVIPEAKQAKEVFWASALVSRLPELQASSPSVVTCLDDSHGNHDVIVNLDSGELIGIQVTELTYELARARQAQTEKFVAEALAYFTKRGLSSARRLLVNCFVPFVAGSRYVIPKVELLADATEMFIREANEKQIVTVEQSKVLFEWVDKGEIYVPSVAGIGLACNLDALPRTLEMYCDAITCLRDKKANSNSPWLLVWSNSFFRDKHWLGNETLEHMKKVFSTSSFKRVFFIESMDGPGYFEANLVVHAIKA